MNDTARRSSFGGDGSSGGRRRTNLLLLDNEGWEDERSRLLRLRGRCIDAASGIVGSLEDAMMVDFTRFCWCFGRQAEKQCPAGWAE